MQILKSFTPGILALIVLAACLSACGDATENDVENSKATSGDADFRSSFRASFVGTCAERDASEENVALCTCMADDLLATFTPDELQDMESMRQHVQATSLPKCQAQAAEKTP